MMSVLDKFWKRLFRRKPTYALVDQMLRHRDEQGQEHSLPVAQVKNWTDHGDPWINYVTLVTSTGEILHWSDPEDVLAALLRRTIPEKEASATRGTW
jgi:hypothetical protein